MYPTQSVGKGLKMLLTYGNIKKSKILKYIYLPDYNDDEYRKASIEYNKSIIKYFEKSDFIKIYKYLHDAKIYLKQINGNVVIKVNTYDSEEKKSIYFDIIFEKAKILSWNTVKENGHISRLNKKYKPREYGYEEFYEDEIPHNWQMVIDICNLLKSADIPVQTIDWAHPNMRDGDLKKYNAGQVNFWKKEHQVKIWANEFNSIGFGIIHKQQALDMFSDELIAAYIKLGKDLKKKTHKYFWESKRKSNKIKPPHPGEDDDFIPVTIRGKHFNSWTEIARELGYHE